MNKLLRKEGGFTLIELMVVVLIISILVAIAIPVFANASANARVKACKASLRTMDGAIQTYIADNEQAPVNPAALVPTYLKAVPTCPGDGTTVGTYSFQVDAGRSLESVCTVHGTATSR